MLAPIPFYWVDETEDMRKRVRVCQGITYSEELSLGLGEPANAGAFCPIPDQRLQGGLLKGR